MVTVGFHFTPGTTVWLIPNLTFLATFTPSFNKHCCPIESMFNSILGPVSQTYNGNKYILVVTDYFTRFAEACNLPYIEATTVADPFICRYGPPSFNKHCCPIESMFNSGQGALKT
jgi:hypothetical protein